MKTVVKLMVLSSRRILGRVPWAWLQVGCEVVASDSVHRRGDEADGRRGPCLHALLTTAGLSDVTQGIPIQIEVRRACSPALMQWGMIWLGAGLQGA